MLIILNWYFLFLSLLVGMCFNFRNFAAIGYSFSNDKMMKAMNETDNIVVRPDGEGSVLRTDKLVKRYGNVPLQMV